METATLITESAYGPVIRPTGCVQGAILYLHHGHERASVPAPSLNVAEKLAVRTGVTAVCAPYRPVFADAFDDVMRAFRYCQELGPVYVVGERLGAWLAATLLLRLRDLGEDMPQAAVLMGGLLDLSLDSRNLRAQSGVEAGYDLNALRERVREWVADPHTVDAQLAPLAANLHGLPAIQVLVAATDPLLDDSLGWVARAAHDRVPVELRVWVDLDGLFRESVHTVVQFLRARIATAGDGTVAAVR